MTARDALLAATRRHFFRTCGVGVGAAALGSLLADEAAAGPPKKPHHPAKAKAVIFLFMAGGPSQFELFEDKPELQKRHGQAIPESFVKGRRFAFMANFTKNAPKLLGTRQTFKPQGKLGLPVSDLLPEFGKIVDDISFVRTVATDVFNHAPAKIFLNTGSPQVGRPSMGAWVTYGLGSEAKDLPGFVVLQSGPRGPRGGAYNWGSGFLPTTHQGVPFRGGGEPIVNLATPPGAHGSQADVIDAVKDLNAARLAAVGDPEIATRIAAYEMAHRMQTAAPDLIDLTQETKETLDLYGAVPGGSGFGNNCLLARRLVERGVRFVQLYHTNWDHHGGPGEDLGKDLIARCRETDRGCAALVLDLKRRGLLDETLVVWGGEFGRTPMGEIRESVGRNHHIDAFPMWFAGGGTKRGFVLGATDDFGFAPAADRVHVHDVQATILHQLGLEHTKLTFRSQGRDFRLTDVHGTVIRQVLA